MMQRPLGVLKELVESLGLAVSYAYEDLVFLDHPHFLLQFTESATEILIHVNEEADSTELSGMVTAMQDEGQRRALKLKPGSFYRASQSAEETVNLEFLSTITI